MILLIDTNLLVLLVVGFASPNFIAGHKRTRTYSVADFETLKDVLSRASAVRTTPHILAETSNLALQFQDPGRTLIGEALRRLIAVSTECLLPSAKAAHHASFRRLGLTDAGVIIAQDTDDGVVTLLTDDLDLYLESLRSGRQAINFAHLRVDR